MIRDMLATLQRLVHSTDSREQKARLAAETIRQGGGYRWVGLYDVSETEISVIGWSGPSAPTYPRFPRDQGLNGAAVARGESLVVQNVRRDSRYLTTLGDTMAEMIVPVRGEDGAIVGTIDVESATINAFSDRDRELLQQCAEILLPLWTASM
jgi:GAF domain-containing protein